ncbi:hypothetical protein QUF70_04545 [Desulfobacterales bacterium HSG17]|nr:hypothetical protein [Desulfobacterales bacterium HSG17]
MKAHIYNTTNLLLISLLILCTFGIFTSANAGNQFGDKRANTFNVSVSDGEDMSFPVNIQKSNYCGIFQMSGMSSPEEQGVDIKDVISALQVCAGLTPTVYPLSGIDGQVGLKDALYGLSVVSGSSLN